ncbi:CHAT domain-containing protein [uncultured Tenacibaculum sp.]|uniref:CHAT domain-containing protein n=1 Tax=uncultured Tenacibaculum sp. TaxID=174713 RepID=UPI0026380B5D|nr:CHAT domain-containing protein [uncultured Tenacibaculum sp.]
MIRLISIILFLFIGVNTSVNSQECLNTFLKKYQDTPVIASSKVDSLLTACNDSIKTQIRIADYFSIYYRKKRKNDLAIKYAQTEVNFYKKLGLKNYGYENVVYNLGKFYYYNKEYDKAIALFDEVIQLDISPLKSKVSLIQIGRCYRDKGDYFIAKSYFTKALNTLSLTNSTIYIYNSFIYLVNINNQIDTEESTLSNILLLNKLEHLLEENKSIQTSKRYYRLNFNRGNVFSNLLRLNYKSDSLKTTYFNKSKLFFEKALEYAKKTNDSSNISLININLGEIYSNYEKDSALYYHKQSLKFNNGSSYNKALSYNNIAFYYLKSNPNLALEYIEKAINVNFSVNEDKKNFIPSDKQLFLTKYKSQTILQLTTKAEVLISLFQKTQNKDYLKNAIETIKIIDRLIDISIQSNYDLNTKFLWRNEASKAYIHGAKAAHLLGDLNNMFYFTEKNRAVLLTESLQQNTNQTSLPKRTSKKLEIFYKNIFELEDSIKQNTAQYSKLNDSLFKIKKEYQTFTDSIKEHHPAVFNNKAKIVSLDQLKPKLNNQSVIVSYILNKENLKDDTLFGLIISKNKNISFEIKNIDTFKSTLNKYKKLITVPLKTKNEFDTFKRVSYNLYNQLFPTNEIKKLIENKDLTIIPDISFENIPFEALNTDTSNLKFLIEHTDISYAYSISFLEFNNTIERRTNNDLTLFAPINFNSSKVSSLAYTKDEIKNIGNIVSGNSFEYDEASKYNFLNKSSDSKIIHLATHADASSNPVIYFSDSILPLRRIYTYKNNADLVILSACETNLGEIKKGEGTLSLARAFFNAGANSVISTLWKVNDGSTSEIMNNFYENLRNHQSKNEALNNAKRNYLKNHSLAEKSPYYWASFVLIGDTKPVFNNYTWRYIGIILIILLLFFSFYLRKDNK